MRTGVTDEIENLMVNLAREMVSVRDSRFGGVWRDAANDTGVIISCEALLAMLLPAAEMPPVASQILGILKEANPEKTLSAIVDKTQEGFYGSPYVDFSIGTNFDEDQDFLDCACFVARAFMYSLKLLHNDLEATLREKMRETLAKALSVIHSCHLGPGKGWSWGHVDQPDEPFLYCTWSAIEALTDLLDEGMGFFLPPDADKLVRDLCNDAAEAKNWLERTFVESPISQGDVNYDITSGIVSFGPEDESAYYNLYIMTSLLLTKSPVLDRLGKALDVVFERFNASRRRYLRDSFTFFFDGKEVLSQDDAIGYSDRSFLPLLLKALSLYVGTDSRRLADYKDRLLKVYELLLENRDTTRYSYVWDEGAPGGSGYSIYYTERAIEALCRLHACATYHQGVPEFASEIHRATIPVEIDLPIDQILSILISKLDMESLASDTFKREIEGLARRVGDLEVKLEILEKRRGASASAAQIREDMSKIKDEIQTKLGQRREKQ